MSIDVLCVGHASYDLVFSVKKHPGSDEKTAADFFIACGGGPAANAAVTVSKLGYRSAFIGYLGNDLYGQKHMQEFSEYGVATDLIARGDSPTPLSVILVKPDGSRTVVNYKRQTQPLRDLPERFALHRPKVMLFDGHEPIISKPLIQFAAQQRITTVLDAGSVHRGTRDLFSQVDCVVGSKTFSVDFTGREDPVEALSRLSKAVASAVITLGQDGLVWENSKGSGRLDSFPVQAVDTTGAGDAFHGAYAAGLAAGIEGIDLLVYASAVGALTCMGYGGRLAIPAASTVREFLRKRAPDRFKSLAASIK